MDIIKIQDIAEKLASTLVDTDYTIEQAAQYCGISNEQLTEEVKEGIYELVFPCVECGRWHEFKFCYAYPVCDQVTFDDFE